MNVPEEEEEGEASQPASQDVQRAAAAAAGHVLLRALPEAARGEGLPLRMVRTNGLLLLLRFFHFSVMFCSVLSVSRLIRDPVLFFSMARQGQTKDWPAHVAAPNSRRESLVAGR